MRVCLRAGWKSIQKGCDPGFSLFLFLPTMPNPSGSSASHPTMRIYHPLVTIALLCYDLPPAGSSLTTWSRPQPSIRHPRPFFAPLGSLHCWEGPCSRCYAVILLDSGHSCPAIPPDSPPGERVSWMQPSSGQLTLWLLSRFHHHMGLWCFAHSFPGCPHLWPSKTTPAPRGYLI